ncbi:MAG: DNA-binding protein [Candidatus Omnitrophota bacterium]|jgi:excisionase family DNA binding protein|nr:MAG: DNA-binding protein [Candidatus Omnitrophota bacterium]
MEEKLLTVRDVASFLGVSEKEVLDLAEDGSIPAYKVGGLYLRFRREQVEDFKRKHNLISHTDRALAQTSIKDRIADFFYFNDFYLFSVLLIVAMLFIIFIG